MHSQTCVAGQIPGAPADIHACVLQKRDSLRHRVRDEMRRDRAKARDGEIDLDAFEEVWQYGSNLGEPNADPIHQQDGVAPQCAVRGLDKIRNPILEKKGRAFIPKGESKGFLQSHAIGNYKWIFKKEKDAIGYVKPRN